jgi:hypothetical protein
MAFRVGGALFLTAAMAAVAACGGSSPESQPASTAAPAAAPAADHSGHAGGKVFFKEPANGATVKSPVHIVFGSDMFTIAPVPEGEVTTVRANTGHYHLGVDTDCLAPGGPHKLVVQAGDDKHATMTGLCETINITVTE